jgi:NAD(P)-dependent dehydrogenase (short-subunit alcohol dehydrogenase family)
LITGAGRGIGRALALGLAAEGMDVVLAARSRAELDEVASLVSTSARVIPTDLRDLAAVRALAERAGAVDVLVNNAAVPSPSGPVHTLDPAEYAEAVAVNVTALVALTIGVLPGMLARRWGRIVNLTSRAATSPTLMNGGNAYTTTKSAVEGHTFNLAGELEGTGVTANLYQPGTVDTSMQLWAATEGGAGLAPRTRALFTEARARGTLLTPEYSAGRLIEQLVGEDNGQRWYAVNPF